MSESEGPWRSPEPEAAAGDVPVADVPAAAADAGVAGPEAAPAAPDAGFGATWVPSPGAVDPVATGIGSLAGSTAPAGTPLPGAPAGEAAAAGWTAPDAPARGKSGLLRRLAIPIVIFAVVVGGVVFRDRLSGSSADLAVGDCFDAPSAANAPAEGAEVGDVQHHPCTEAHLYETFAVLKHPADKGAPYPGIEVLFAYAETNCLPPFEAYVGLAYDASSLAAGSIVPKEDGWKDGERSITCYVGSADDTPVTGSLKGAHK